MLEDLKNNIARLIALYEGEKQRADMLAAKLEESLAETASCRLQINEMKARIDSLKLAGAFTGSGDNVAAKEEIDKLIREIDKCIRLLEN